MVATAAEKGYEATTVADLVELSGVSRKAFYEHFGDKLDCFLATLEEILAAARGVTAAKLRREGSWEARTRRALDSFVELVVAQPAAARLCLVESYAAGPAATGLIDEAANAFRDLLQQTFDEQPERRGMPAEMTRAMVGGLRKTLHTRLHRGTQAELIELAPELLDLGLSYRPPPRALGGTPRRRGATNGAQGDNGDTGVVAKRNQDPGERIAWATMTAIAARGYQAATLADIAEAAGVSLSTFYEHFDGKAEAFDAALYGGRTRLLGVTMPAYRRARSWPQGVCAVTVATLGFLEEEPEFARLIAIDIYTAGSEALERRDRAIEATQRVFDEGAAQHAPETEPIVREAVVNGLYAMLCNRVAERGTEGLREMAPLANYMALAPFLGAEEACAVARGERRESRKGSRTTD